MRIKLLSALVSRNLFHKQVRWRTAGRLFPRQYRKLSGNPRTSYTVISVALLLIWFLRCKRKPHVLYFSSDSFQESNKQASDMPFKYNGSPGNTRETKRLSGTTELSKQEEEEWHNARGIRSFGPPSYLPLAQYLKHMNYSRRVVSLRDMVFGAEKRTYPDLEPTRNYDLLNCEECSKNCKALGVSIPYMDHQLQIARLAVRLVTFYNFSSMLILPCVDEMSWILPLNAGIRKFKPNFETYCSVSSDRTVVDLMKRYDRRLLSGLRFVVYQPLNHGKLPTVDLMLSRRGLERYDLETIQEVFKDALKQEIKYVLLGNSPRYENARVVETDPGTFSIKRPDVLALNVRAYPFGFNAATRVFSAVGKQLLFYKTRDMRDGWIEMGFFNGGDQDLFQQTYKLEELCSWCNQQKKSASLSTT